MGGSFGPIVALDGSEHPPSRDWNLVCDPEGAVDALNAGFELLYVPIDVTFGVPLLRSHVDRLRGGDDLCKLLADLVDAWGARSLTATSPPDVAAYLHDPLTIACVVECEFVEKASLAVSVVLDAHGVAHTVVDPTEGHLATVVRRVDAPGFADWLVETLLA